MPIKQNRKETSSAHHLILASTSPRRRQFLEILNIPFSVVSPGFAAESGEVDETPLPNEAPADLVQRLSRLKAQAVTSNLAALRPSIDVGDETQLIIIAADTVVVLNGEILGKPETPAEAVQMLESLRGRAHEVYSGLTVAYPSLSSLSSLSSGSSRSSGRSADQAFHLITQLHQSKVWMRPYSDEEITTYVATGSPLDKAGAYGIQDQPFTPVERLEGCFASVMGLPLVQLTQVLVEIGIPTPSIGPLCSQHTGVPCCQISVE